MGVLAMEEIIFTTSALLEILSQIDELSDYEITINEYDGTVKLSIGESEYTIEKPTEQVTIPDRALKEVSAINDTTYEELGGEPIEDVTSGIIKETIKTLLVGGAVRLVSKILKGR